MGRLDELDLSLSLPKGEYGERLEAAQTRLTELRLALGGKLPGYEGEARPCAPRSSSRAGTRRARVGLIRRSTRSIRGTCAWFVRGSDADEKRHHFLWRFCPAFPGRGGMTVFDRSWYGRVLVERVEGFATPRPVGAGYARLSDFERSLGLEGRASMKFWIHVSAEEQLNRFKERESNPLKQLEADRTRLA